MIVVVTLIQLWPEDPFLIARQELNLGLLAGNTRICFRLRGLQTDLYLYMVYVMTLVSSSYNMAPNDCMIVNYEFERMWTEAVWPHLNYNSGIDLWGESEDNHEQSKPG
jgi:hypothetical protein